MVPHSQKNIVLQNGERVSGQILSLQNGVYAIKTKLGILNIKESEIASIESAASPVVASQPVVSNRARE